MSDFKPYLTAPSSTDKNWIHYSAGGYNYCIQIKNGSCIPNCVGYVWGEWRKRLGKSPKLSKGDASTFWGFKDGYSRTQFPRLGSVICWDDGGYGHVGCVEKYDQTNGKITVAQSAYNGTRFYLTEVMPPYHYGRFKCRGFIHLPGSEPLPKAGTPLAGKQKYIEIVQPLIDACAVQSKWMEHYKYVWQSNPTIAKSKTKGTCVTYVACVLQRLGIIASGKYIWTNGRGYGTGKVTGAVNELMHVDYMKNKTIKALKDEIRAGDILIVDDNRSGRKGDGGHIFVFRNWNGDKPMIWDNNTAHKGCHTIAYNPNRKVLVRIRVKSYRVETAVTNGTITAPKQYLAKQDAVITYKPSAGRVLKSVTVDGKAVDIKKYPTSYTFKNVVKKHTIKVVFA